MSAEIFYFSGTGNSLHVAKGLAARLEGASLRPIIGCLRSGRTISSVDVVGFVFPVHALCIPIAVRRFLRRLKISTAGYLFGLATREGTAVHGFKQMDRLLGRKGRRLDARFVITMHTTDPRAKGYRAPSPVELYSIQVRIEKELDEIARAINDRATRQWKERTPPIPAPYGKVKNYIVERLVVLAHKTSEYVGGVNYFYADVNCTRCGICSMVCLSGKIRPDEAGNPLWQKQVLCYMCFACVSFCPKQSVQIRSIWAVESHSTENGRYGHPFATVAAVADQKAEHPPT